MAFISSRMIRFIFSITRMRGKIDIETGGKLPHEPGPHHKLVRYRLRFGGRFFQSWNEQTR